MDSRAEAVARVRRAMQLVEQAQNLLGEACRELSPVVGGVREWRAVSALYDRAQAAWYRLERLAGRAIDLDEGTKAAMVGAAEGR